MKNTASLPTQVFAPSEPEGCLLQIPEGYDLSEGWYRLESHLAADDRQLPEVAAVMAAALLEKIETAGGSLEVCTALESLEADFSFVGVGKMEKQELTISACDIACAVLGIVHAQAGRPPIQPAESVSVTAQYTAAQRDAMEVKTINPEAADEPTAPSPIIDPPKTAPFSILSAQPEDEFAQEVTEEVPITTYDHQAELCKYLSGVAISETEHQPISAAA